MCMHASFLLHQSLGYIIKLLKLEALNNPHSMLCLLDLPLPLANTYMLQKAQSTRQNAVLQLQEGQQQQRDVRIDSI